MWRGFQAQKRRPLTSIDVPMVPKAGLEPARISTVDFESTASTDFATSALKGMRKTLRIIPLPVTCATSIVANRRQVTKNSPDYTD